MDGSELGPVGAWPRPKTRRKKGDPTLTKVHLRRHRSRSVDMAAADARGGRNVRGDNATDRDVTIAVRMYGHAKWHEDDKSPH